MKALMRKLFILSFGIQALVLLIGCSHRETSWDEEVRLSDGTVLLISREVLHEPGGALGQGSWLAVSERLEFVEPLSGQTVLWSQQNRLASYVDRINGHYWIVAGLSVCRPENKGQPFWQPYLLTATGWVASHPADSPHITAPNLVLDAANISKTSEWRLLTLKDKSNLDRQSVVDRRARTIAWPSEINC